MATIKEFADLLANDQRRGYCRRYGDAHPDLVDAASFVRIKMGKVYAKVDVGHSGKYMVPLPGQPDAGHIFGIKAYGVIHRGHQYGTLETIHEWDWSEYTATPRQEKNGG